MNLVEAVSHRFNSAMKALTWIGYISIIVMILVTFADVTGRYLFLLPLPGAYQIIEYAMAAMAGFAMSYTTTQLGHIVVDLFLNRYKRRAQIIVNITGSWLGFATWAVIAYKTFSFGMLTLTAGEHGVLERIIQPIFIFILSLGLFLYCLTLLMQALCPSLFKKEEGGSTI
jgi:TRAP-type C4-dicarboxylate transport system permease small subunit